MKYILLLIIGILYLVGFSQQDNYHRVKIFANDEQLLELQSAGIAIDHGIYRKGVWFESDFSDSEILLIKNHDINYEIVINDVSSFYQTRNLNENASGSESLRSDNCSPPNISNFATPLNFKLGSMGGFFTYQEFIAHLDTMFSKFPNLITKKDTIDTFLSIEGRPIYWLKISDNPAIDENESEILYTAVHHAREPASLSQTIMYMYYLLENYGTNDEVTYLVDHTELYFIPMVNPDGYIYNESTNPNGGGQWRKNRRNNGNGTMGVDLNRNYGHNWGYDDSGSSPDSGKDTYRGTSAFSEPEIQATKWFTEHHNFLAALNYHTFGNLLIFPWGYKASIYTPDSAVFQEYAKILTQANKYNFGTGDQTVGYITNGDSDDWMYGEQTTKNKILSFTPEAGQGSDGFWPQKNRIETISKENIRQNLNLAWLVNNYAIVEDLSPTLIETKTFYLTIATKRLGFDSIGTYTVTLNPLGNFATVSNNAKTYSNLAQLESKLDSFQVSLDNLITEGQAIEFELSIDNGSIVFIDTITKIYGKQQIIFADNNSTMQGFSSNDGWELTTDEYFSSPSSFCDSPDGFYQNNANTSLFIDNSINLTKATQANISFMGRWEIENGYDYVQLVASKDGGNSWKALCGNYTKTGTEDQDDGQPLYDGFQVDWIAEEISLNDYLGEVIQLKFQLISDAFVNHDGFFFDDLKIKILGENLIGINNANQPDHIKIYPNPNDGRFTVEFINTNNILKITNLLGQPVAFSSSSQGNKMIINGLNKGSYLISLSNDKEIFQQKIIVQ